MKIVDANFILRYLLNDIEDQAKEAFAILNSETISLLNEGDCRNSLCTGKGL